MFVADISIISKQKEEEEKNINLTIDLPAMLSFIDFINVNNKSPDIRHMMEIYFYYFICFVYKNRRDGVIYIINFNLYRRRIKKKTK